MVVALALKHADDTEMLIRESKPLQKAQAISHRFARHGNRDKDAVFSFGARGSHKCASRVLAEIASCAAFFGKLVGTMLLTMSFVGVDISTNLVVLGMSMLASGLFAISNTAKATSALIPLSISNPFYVGEIVRTISTDCFCVPVWSKRKPLRFSPRFLVADFSCTTWRSTSRLAGCILGGFCRSYYMDACGNSGFQEKTGVHPSPRVFNTCNLQLDA
eukprot:COSAG02_NODE_1780_length_10949_cov_6.987281_1_plen_218_part_00